VAPRSFEHPIAINHSDNVVSIRSRQVRIEVSHFLDKLALTRKGGFCAA
jgi:hypothetical protein